MYWKRFHLHFGTLWTANGLNRHATQTPRLFGNVMDNMSQKFVNNVPLRPRALLWHAYGSRVGNEYDRATWLSSRMSRRRSKVFYCWQVVEIGRSAGRKSIENPSKKLLVQRNMLTGTCQGNGKKCAIRLESWSFYCRQVVLNRDRECFCNSIEKLNFQQRALEKLALQ